MKDEYCARLRQDAESILRAALRAADPEAAVRRMLTGAVPSGHISVVAVGKAAWTMAHAAAEVLGERLEHGFVITKYGHSRGAIPRTEIYEAGHPTVDENSVAASRRVLDYVSALEEGDTVLFLLSGGGSALFEVPLIPLEELQTVNRELLRSGADITEINTVRKRLSGVKGGRFAEACAPAGVYGYILSDVLGDPVDVIASGPSAADSSTAEEAIAVAEKYGLTLSPEARKLLSAETEHSLPHAENRIIGNCRTLLAAGRAEAEALGYEVILLTDHLTSVAREAGADLGRLARRNANPAHPVVYLAAGETVVHVTGSGLGGRNQEIALSAAGELDGLTGCAVFSFGSDGTDGPTDAAGGYADGETAARLRERGISIGETLRNNDAYHALDAVGGLLRTGPTGTNVNDLSVVLLR